MGGAGMDFDELGEAEWERRRRDIAFVGFWPGFDDDTDRWVSKRWFAENLVDVRVVGEHEAPSVVLFSLFGGEDVVRRWRRRPRYKLVFFTGENCRPPLRKVPLCISFERTSLLRSLHLRLPIWVFDRQVRSVVALHEQRLRGERARDCRKGFCAWVASNEHGSDSHVRNSFVDILSRRREVACGGAVRNNTGGPVEDKLAFQRGHRFAVAFENASHAGYCTEKVLHAFASGCLPIYWGDPACRAGSGEWDFNPEAVLSAHDFESLEALADYVLKVDADPELYERYMTQPVLQEGWYLRLRDWGRFMREVTDAIFDGADRFQDASPRSCSSDNL